MTKSSTLLVAAVITSSALLTSAKPVPSSTSTEASLTDSMTNEELAIACQGLWHYRQAVATEKKDLKRESNDVDDIHVIKEKLAQDKLGLRKATEACKRIAEMNNGGEYMPHDDEEKGEQYEDAL